MLPLSSPPPWTPVWQPSHCSFSGPSSQLSHNSTRLSGVVGILWLPFSVTPLRSDPSPLTDKPSVDDTAPGPQAHMEPAQQDGTHARPCHCFLFHELAHWRWSRFFLRTWTALLPRTGTNVNNLFLGSTPDGRVGRHRHCNLSGACSVLCTTRILLFIVLSGLPRSCVVNGTDGAVHAVVDMY